MRSWVKICGLTRPRDASLAVDLGADLVGISFYPPSPRFVSLDRAAEISRAVGGRVPVVGVFVNEERSRVEEIAGTVDLDLLQFHGDEEPEDLEPFGLRAIKVFRRRKVPTREELSAYAGVWGFLFDVPHSRFYGGSGRTWDYSVVARIETDKPILIAGGVTPANACTAIAESRASGIDVCSGVEAGAGIKSPEFLRKLFAEVRDGQEGSPT